MIKGVAQLHLSEEIMGIISNANERAGRLGLHIVHIFNKDVICGALDHRSGYFEQRVEAEIFAQEHFDRLRKTKATGFVLLDNELFGGSFVGDDTKEFMNGIELPDCELIRYRQLYYYPHYMLEAEFKKENGESFYIDMIVHDGEKFTDTPEADGYHYWIYDRPIDGDDMEDPFMHELDFDCDMSLPLSKMCKIWNENPVFKGDDAWKER